MAHSEQDSGLHVERLAAAMVVMRGIQTVDELREGARKLIAAVKANPFNPNGDDDAAIVDDLIESIGVLKSKAWEDVRRVLIRSEVHGI